MVVVVVEVVLLMALLLMLLGSFLANDAAASFDERRLPPAAKRGQVSGEGSPGAEQELLAGSPVGRTRQKFLRADPELDAVERRWSRSGVWDECTQGYLEMAPRGGLTRLTT